MLVSHKPWEFGMTHIRVALCTFAVVPALAACSSAVGQVRLPPKSANVAATATMGRAPTRRQQVLAAFVGYMAALHQADLSGNAALARQLLDHGKAVERY